MSVKGQQRTCGLRYVCRACANYSAAFGRFFSPDCAGNSTAVRVRSFAPNTITWMCGYFCLSFKPAFDAASAVSYWDLTLPSTSKPYPSTGNVLALRFLGLASSSLTCFSIIVLFKRSALKAFSFVSSLTLLSIVMFLVDLPCRALSLKRWSWLDATLNYRVIFSCQVFGQ